MSNSNSIDKIDPLDLALLGSKVSIDEDGNVLPNGDKDTKYRLILRSPKNGKISSKAKTLVQCKGLKGCEFSQCAEKIFGKLPRNLQNLCEFDKSNIR